MINLENLSSPYPLVDLGDCVEVLDRLRKPVNADTRRERQGDIPYYGANGRVGWIDEWIFDEELVLVAEDGGFFDDPFKPISYRVSGKSWVNNHAHVLRPKAGLDIDWLNYVIAYQDIRALIKGATLKKLNQRDLKAIKVPFPDYDEQLRLVAILRECLTRVDELEFLGEQNYLESLAVLPSVLEEVFSGVHSSAPHKSIGDLAVETRYGTSKKCHFDPIGMPILRIPNVANGALDFRNVKFCELARAEADRIRLKDGDLLFVRTNGSRDLVGRCAVFKDSEEISEYGFASYLIRVRVNSDEILPQYLAYFLNSTRGRAEIDIRRRTSAGQYNINSENLRSIALPVPDLSTQAQILKDLKERERQAVALVDEYENCRTVSAPLRGSILQKALSGEL